MQRADPDQAAVGADQGGTAPKRVSGCSKDRVVEHVFPITGKFLASDDPRGDSMTSAALGGHDGAISSADAQPDPEIDRLDVQSPQRLNETEAGLVVGGEHVPRYSTAAGGGEPDRLG